jgi:NADH-quinone oxidoreductase subunit M
MPNDVMPTLLLVMLVLPFVTAVVVALLGPARADAIRWLSLGATVVSLILAVVVAVAFAREHYRQQSAAGQEARTFRPEFVPGAPHVSTEAFGREPNAHATSWELVGVGPHPGESIQFFIGVDGLNVWLVVLTAVLMVSAVLVSWTAITERVPEFYAWLLALGTGMMGVFLAFDIILFYVFFELTLVPLFFLIGIWGGPQRRYAARKFFIYTLAGSLITLLGLLAVVVFCYANGAGTHANGDKELTFSIPRLVELVDRLVGREGAAAQGWLTVQFWIFLALMAGFAIKVPLVPLHTWLPLAHVEAPTAGSVLLAGVLLKIGAYGFLRLCLPLTPDAALSVGVPLIGGLAVIGIVYGSLCALAQDDIKKLVAYSSVSHLGFCMLGMFALNLSGLSGGLLQMVNHGLSTGALFLLVGMLYERYHTRMMADYGGLGARLRLLACFMVFIVLTSIGLPGLNGFVGEVLVLMGAFDLQWERRQWPWRGVVGATGVVLGAWYLLTMLQRVFFGPVREPSVPAEAGHDHGPVGDLNLRELAALVPIAVLCVAIGVYPRPLLDTAQRDLRVVLRTVDQARERAAAREQQPSDKVAEGGKRQD